MQEDGVGAYEVLRTFSVGVYNVHYGVGVVLRRVNMDVLLRMPVAGPFQKFEGTVDSYQDKKTRGWP